MNKHLLLLSILLLTACGGGGGNDEPGSPITPLVGTWHGNLALVQDDCMTGINPLAETHGISVFDDEVELSSNGRILEGAFTSENSFEVYVEEPAPGGSMIDHIFYRNIFEGKADVEVWHSWSRPSGCTTIWKGPMEFSERQ